VQAIEHGDHNRFTTMIGCTWQGEGSDQAEFFQEVRRRGIPLHIFPQRNSVDPAPLLAAARLVRDEQIDLIETHGYKACFIGVFLKLLTRKPWITVMHGHTAENSKTTLYAKLELFLVRFADRIVTVSAEMRRRLVAAGLPAERTVTIPNAIDPTQFTGSEEAVNRARYGVGDEETLIGVVGRFSPEKGQDFFIAAFKRLAAVHPSVKVIFLGEGPTEDEVRELVQSYGLQDRVIFAGYQPCLAMFYPLLDLVVMPSRSEGMPSVALEALYFRIPVVATDVGGTGEVIIDGQTGRLIPPGDPEQLAAGIESILSDKTLQERVAAAGYDYIQQRFLPETRTRSFETLYGSLLGRG
jgi:glycosyltransferase involved in cell wall biosynthesis